MDESKPHNFENRVWIALRMGWVLSEIYGRLTQPSIRWANLFSYYSPKRNMGRLFISTREPSTGEALWSDLLSLIFLTQQLYPPTEAEINNSHQRFSGIYPPESLLDLIEIAQNTMLAKDDNKFALPENFFNDFNHWSRQIWAILNAEDPLIAEAATLGAGLADTYWQWRLQRYNPTKEQTWKKLLTHQRMLVMIRRIRQIEKCIPGYFGITLRHSLREWSEAARNGTLQRLAPTLSITEKDILSANKCKKNELDSSTSNLSPEILDEKKSEQSGKSSKPDEVEEKLKQEEVLRDTFKKQLIIWEDLIFNRPITYHLTAKDWWQLRVLSIVIYIFIASVLVITPALFFYSLISITNSFLTSYIQPSLMWLGKITAFDDQLKLATSVLTVIVFIATQFRKVANWIKELYPAIYNWLLTSILIQRTFISWDEIPKSITKIWWKRFWYGDD